MPTTQFHFPWYGGGGPIEVEGAYNGLASAGRPIPFTGRVDGMSVPVQLDQYRRRARDRRAFALAMTASSMHDR